jgi:hypothetical protein
LPAVHLISSFVGLDTNAQGGLVEPPDTIAAAGPNQVVEVINSNLAFYNKSTGAQLFTEDLGTFFQSVDMTPSLLSDVYVAYDESVGRFIVSTMDIDFTSSVSLFNFAVSNDSNPMDGFSEMHSVNTTEVSGRTGETLFTDFPRLGWNADAYFVSFNMFGFTTQSFQYNTQILTIDKQSVLDKSPGTLTFFQTDRPVPNSTMVPVTNHDAVAGDPEWFVEEKGVEQDGSFQFLRVVKETNYLSNTPTFTDYYVAVDTYTITPFPFDPLATVTQEIDTRILSADLRGGHLVAGQNVGIASDMVVHARWYDLVFNSGVPALFQQGTLNPGPTTNTYYPSLGVGLDGSFGMTYIESSDTENMSMYVTGRVPGDPLGAMETPQLVQAGVASYTGSRAGDFSSVALDPVDGTFWAANEYAIAVDPTNPTAPNFGTFIANFDMARPHLAISVTSPETAGTAFNITVTALDASNNVDPTYADTVHFTSTDPAAVLPPDYTFMSSDNGVHTFSVTLRTRDSQSITATDTSDATINGTASLTVTPAVEAYLLGTTLMVQGDDNANSFLLRLLSGNPSTEEVLESGIQIGTFSRASFTSIQVNGWGGNDSLAIDATNGDPNVPGGISFDGGTGVNTLIAPNLANTWNISSAGGGTLVNTGTVTFTNVENLTGGTSTDAFVFSSSGSLTGIMDGGAGSNRVDYSALAGPISMNLQSLTASLVGGFANIQQVIGSASTADALIGPNVTNTWSISSANGGKIFNSLGTFVFSGIENLVGGSGTDAFKFSTASGMLSGTINGGLGSNRIDYSALATPLVVNLQTSSATLTAGFTAVQQVIGSTAAANLLIGPNLVNTWSISSLNGGKLFNTNGTFTFSGMGNLQGGNTTDAFKFSTNAGAVSGTIDGGPGSNRLDYSAQSGPINVNLQTLASSDLAAFAHIQQVIGSSSAADTLIGPNVTNTWSISSLGGGKIFNSSGTFTFSAMENLTGGSGTDVFDFSTAAGAIAGMIDGQGGTNWLEYLGYTVGVTVNLATGTATGASGGINNIQNVIGGAGDDTITGNALGNVLVGGAGNDVINGGSGRSLLIGGAGTDTVTGGSADDIVIGGTTNYDLSPSALQSILNEWQRTDKSYADRITDLRNGTGLNGPNKLIFGTTVHDDGAANVLTGGAGMDWFFMGAVDIITDLMPGEQVN